MGCIVLIVVEDARAYSGASSRYFGKNNNRLPEQTQRRPYGCAPLVLRRVIAKKKFSLGG